MTAVPMRRQWRDAPARRATTTPTGNVYMQGYRAGEAATRAENQRRLRRARDRALWLGTVIGTGLGATIVAIAARAAS